MAYVRGMVNYIVDVSDDEDRQVLVHLRDGNLSYTTIFREGPAEVVYHLVQSGDTIGLEGTITVSEVDTTLDIDTVKIEVMLDGEMRQLDVGYCPRYTVGVKE